MQFKVKINIAEGTIELEGSEEFVTKYLEEFKERIYTGSTKRPMSRTKLPRAAAATTPRQKGTSVKKGAKVKAKSIAPERFDLHKSDDQPSLKDFLEEKKPGENTGNLIVVIAYYITHLRNQPSFSEGNIDYAYRTLSIKGRPKHLRQIIINNKNQRDLFEEAETEGNWSLTRSGEIFVEEQLPAQDKK